MEPDAAEIRVLGCLIEKQRTTPDQYPLSLNAVRLACNQSTNREPVVDYDENTVRAALNRLGERGWTRMATWSSSRTKKYRHLLPETLSLSDAELSLLAVLMLRGAQTPGELKQRSERMHPFASPAEVEEVLDELVDRELATRLPRQPGKREQRYQQLLGGHGGDAPAAPVAREEPREPPTPPPAADGLEGRVSELERELAAVRDDLRTLREQLGA